MTTYWAIRGFRCNIMNWTVKYSRRECITAYMDTWKHSIKPRTWRQEYRKGARAIKVRIVPA